ncbi:MAG: hypothetical protein ACRYG8_03425 [Janthinobacterium lividum]
MSGSTSDALPGQLSDSERTDVRRFCGYPAYGNGNSGFQSWRFFSAYGVLEFKLNNLAPAELAQVRVYLAQLAPLETGILGAAANLDTASAAVWTRNPAEVRDRERLFDGWRRRLAAFLGVPPGPEFGGGDGGRIVI